MERVEHLRQIRAGAFWRSLLEVFQPRLKFILALAFCFAVYLPVASSGHLRTLYRAAPDRVEYKNGNDWRDWGHNYYPLLAEAVRHGQVSLLVSPPEELLKLSDPYDPVQNAKFRLHDASLYNGKYYMYWGIGPVFVWYLPVHAVMNRYPSDDLTRFVFTALALIFFSLAILEMMKGAAVPSDPSFLFSVVGSLGLNGVVLSTLQGPTTYAVTYTFSTCFIAVSTYFFTKIVLSSRLSRWDLFGLGMATAIAVSGKPNLVLALGPFAAFAGGLVFLRNRKAAFLSAVLLLLPLAACLVALMIYNFIRFGSPSEFGLGYQLVGGWNSRHIHLYSFTPRAVWFTLKAYLFHSFRVSEAFPFLTAQEVGLKAPIIMTTPNVGLFVLLPQVLLVFLAAIASGFKKAKSGTAWFRPNDRLDACIVGFSVTGMIALVFTLVMAAVAQRYQMDYVGLFILAAAAWTLSISDSRTRERLNMLWQVCGLFSAVVGILLSFQYWLTVS